LSGQGVKLATMVVNPRKLLEWHTLVAVSKVAAVVLKNTDNIKRKKDAFRPTRILWMLAYNRWPLNEMAVSKIGG